MRITVLGGSGFLGSHVADKLSESGHEVTIFDLRPSPWLKPGQNMILGDILDGEAVKRVVSGAEVVFNFAGIADIGEANGRPVDTVRYNIMGNVHALEASRLAGVSRYIFASSVYVYSQSGGFYRCSKQACETYIETYREAYGLDYTILRYGSLYGPRADERNAIHRFIVEALRDKKIRYFGNPEALREYIHVEDAALCSVEILKPEYVNQSIVLTGSQPMTVGNLFRMIAEMLGEEIEFEFQHSDDGSHYRITPYSFNPKVGKRLTPPLQVDLGQGLLRIIEDVHKGVHPELGDMYGVLIKDDRTGEKK